MSAVDRGPLQEYEIVWRSGHIDRVCAHQATYRGGDSLFSRGAPTPERFMLHGEIDGQWMLLFDALRDELLSIRNVTQLGADGPPA